MRHLACGLLWLSLACGSAQGATYHVRTDGGDASQCTGLADAPYPGSGTNQACAWKSLHHALPTGSPARIVGGDTVYIGAGSHMIGWGAPGAAGGRCYAGGPYDCYLPPIPSGPSPAQKTRILGKSCTVPPKLWGNERVSQVLNLEGSSNVEVGCLEITDQSDCVEFHTNATARCARDTAPYGQWASVGISARASSNVYLHDLNVHGLANRGFVGGGLSNWTLERVKLVANGWAGWDGDIGAASTNAGAIVLRNVEIAWNGCGQKWQTGAIWACWAQTNGGYGDGLGTATTGGQWLIEDSYIHHNTSDGLDLLYMDGGASSSVTIRRVHAVGNAGNQLKTKGTTLIENSVVVGNCAYFNGRDSMSTDDQCRALGNAISIAMIGGQNATVRNNTITGEGDCLLLTEGGTSTSNLTIQNNALVGAIDWRGNATGNPGELSCGHFHYNAPGPVTYTKNLFWNVKQSQCPSGSVCGQDPKLTDRNLAAFNPDPLAGSPLIDQGVVLGAVTSDFYTSPRPSGISYDIGAVEVQSGGTPPPACTRAAPTVRLSGSSTGVAAGSAQSYVLSVTNNDSSVCASSSFMLARTVPAGWVGSLAATSLALAPGGSGNTSLTVTSAATAAAGSYGIGAGVSSGAGSVHTGNASATYTVATATQACTRAAPSVSLSGSSSGVAAGSAQSYVLSVTNNDSGACGNSSYMLARTVPAGWVGSLAATSLALAPGSRGNTTLTVTSTGTAAAGSYGIGAGTSSSAGSVHTGNASATYTVTTTAPAPAPAPASTGLTELVATNKTAYLRGELVYMSSLVRRNGVAVAGAEVFFTLDRQSGGPVTWSGISGSNGYVRWTYRLPKASYAVGNYKLTGVVSNGGTTVTASSSFTAK